ncbi:MAG: hypothetical protein IJJ01_02630 [Firmicutes bacterium]|jgi:hypothetical protein|nr:hypothetical protein [Bacillota bacterium]
MSTYYEFYAAVEKDGKIEAIGPYIRKDGEYRLTPILSRSRSFIQWDEFGYWDLQIEKMAEDQIEFFTDTGWISDERQSISYYIPYKDIAALADDGLVQGYVTLDELNMVSAAHYSQDALWDIWVKTPEVAAEMDPETRKQYGHIAYIDRCSTGYICSQLANMVDPIEYGYESEELRFIVRVC